MLRAILISRTVSDSSHLLKFVVGLPCSRWQQLSTAPTSIQLHGSYLELRLEEKAKNFHFDYMWLRDHCQCQYCYNVTTHQRSLSLLNIPSNIKPSHYDIEATKLTIKWSDNHTSTYNVNWLSNICNPEMQEHALCSLNESRILWTENEQPPIPKIDYKEFLSSDSMVANAMSSIMEHGIVTITKVPPTIQDTQKAVERIAPVQHTFFGGMWEFGTAFLNEDTQKDILHEDTAYTKDALDPHNDSTYFTESTGLQVFHCLGRSQSNLGGETVLVDGIAAANKLATTHPEYFKILSSIPIESEYKEPGRHYVNSQPIIVLDSRTNHIHQIRFNLYDRAPFRTISNTSQIREYYEALRKLTKIMLSHSFSTKILLTPGTVLILDNWRILHGRTAFSGNRHMTGCYVSRFDWLSKARVLGLLN